MFNFNQITNKEFLSKLFRNLARQKQIPVSVDSSGSQFEATMAFGFKNADKPDLRFDNPDLMLEAGEKIRVIFFFKDVLFYYETQITGQEGNSFQIKNPEAIYTSFRRLMYRYKPAHSEELSLYLPEDDIRYKVHDLSTSGASFEGIDKYFDEGQVFRNITINLNNVEDIHVDAIVKYCRTMSNGNFVCGINFTGMDWLTRQKLFLYIFQRAYPDLKALKDYSSDEILKLYEDSKYLRLKPDNDGENSFVEMVRNIDLLKDKPMIYSNFSYIRNGKLSCIGSVIRIFNRTFFGNRPVTLTNTGLNSIARSDLHIGLAEAMLNHSYFSYYVSYFTRDYSWHKEMFGRLGSFINDKDKIIFGKLQYFECNISELDYIKQNKGYKCKVLEDPTDFIEYCKINMEPLEAECYGYDKENFYLNEISQLYEMIGFYANRRLMGVYREEKLAAFVVAECYSEGVSLNSINDGCRIYIPADEVDVQAVIRSAVSGAAVFYKKHKKEKFNILFDYLIKKTELEKIPGADYKGEIGRVMMNYDGMADYKKILLLNFDFLTKYYPLTYPQRDIWYKEKLIPDTDIGNISATIRFEDIDFSLLEKSINMVIERNEGMRIRVVEEYDEPRQYISEYNYRKFDFFDFSNEGKKGLFEWDKLENRISFEITDSDLFYFALFKINEREGGFYIKMHHLISDAWTMVLMTNQVFESYKKLKNGAVTGDGNKPPYIDYILGEEEYLYSDNFEKNKKFWADKFNSIPQFTSLKTVNMQCLNLEATRKTYIIPLDLTIKIKKFLEQSKLSVFMLMMSALYIYLYRITSKEDIVIGTPVLNRSNAKEKNMAGMFISAVPVRIYINGEDSFESFVKYVSKELMLCFKNQKYPYELILKDYRDNNNTNGILNDIVFSYQNAKLEIGEYVENYDARWHFNGSQTESLVIHLNDREDKNEYIVNIDYLVNDFSYDEIERLYEHLLNILKDAIENSSKKIYELEILSQEEKRKLLYDFNNTGADYPKNKTIHELFEEQVNRTPDNVALVCEDKEITYRELNAKANQLAKILKTKGVGKDIIVAVIYERSIEMIVCILGIMKAGGAYLPIDPDYPEERINYMISDSQTNIVLIQENLLHKFDIKIEKLSFNFDSFCEEMGSDIETDGNSDDLAYVIYTSGSTGNPKGVMIQHRGLINFIWWRIQNYKINSKDITLQLISFSFDGFGANLYSSILTGGKLVILNNTRWKDFNYVRRKIKLMKVTNMSLVPSMYKEILSNANMSDLASMRFVVLAGEKSSEYLIKQSKAINNQINLINEYGPTENCITTTAYLGMDEKTHSIIGKPISNTYIYILDSYGGLVPIGVYGELYVSGENLSKGYINNKKLTDEKFVNNPYMRENKMYKTGDIARWLPDGNIEFLGRIDSQIKVQGVRIELEEIRSAVAEYPSITDVIVLPEYQNCDSTLLCAYFVSNNEVSAEEIKGFLRKRLPIYLIPSHFIRLEKIPLLPNGKIDKNNLPEVGRKLNLSTEKCEARNEQEKLLSYLFSDTINLEKVYIDDNFFELGGNSIKATSLVFNIRKALNINISVIDIYDNPTVRELSDYISLKKQDTIKKTGGNTILLKRANNKQSNLFFIHNGSGEVDAYIKLSKVVEDKFDVWGIKAERLDKISISDVRIEKIASRYLDQIREIQPKGPYYLAGWCIGGTIAYEIASQLEEKNEGINFCGLINSIPPQKNISNVIKNLVDIDSIIEVIMKNLCIKFFDKKTDILKEKSIIDFFINLLSDNSIEYAKIHNAVPDFLSKAIPGFQNVDKEGLLYYFNFIKMFDNCRECYIPLKLSNVPVCFFKASENNKINEKLWENYTGNYVKFVDVPGNHYSMFEEPNIFELSKCFKNHLYKTLRDNCN